MFSGLSVETTLWLLNRGKGFHKPVSSDGSVKQTSGGLKPSEQVLKYIEKTSSLGFIDYMIFRAIKETSETGHSLETLDLNYLVKINEYLDITNYIDEDIERQAEKASKTK